MQPISDRLQSSTANDAGMMPSKTDKDEILYMDEIHNDASKPLTSVNVNDVPHIRSRAGPLVEAELPNTPRTTLGSELNDLNEDEKQSIGFDDELLARRPFSNQDFFPETLPPQITPDVNLYQHKKTLAQGMMDLALLSANANQMRYVLQTDDRHPYFYPSLTMISMSLILQITVGIGLIWNSRYNVKEHDEMCKANKANNWTVIGIFLVTILNVFISSFGVVDQMTPAPVTTAVATT